MSAPDRAQELIDRYLDEIITADELEELEALLVKNPAAARLFSRSARMDGLLHAHFNGVRAGKALRLERRAPQAAREWPWRPVGAAIVGLAALLVLALILVPRPRDEERLVEVTIVKEEPVEFDTFTKKPPEPAREETELPALPPPEQERPAPPTGPPSLSPPVELAAVMSTVGRVSPAQALASRSEPGRFALAGRYAPQIGREAEAAVQRALQWLKAHQRADGSWPAGAADTQGPSEYNVAVTSLGLLAFLSHGETSASEVYGETVDRAIRYLLWCQAELSDPEGAFCAIAGSGLFAHALAMQAISEACLLTPVAELRESLNAAVAVTVDARAGDRWHGEVYADGIPWDGTVGEMSANVKMPSLDGRKVIVNRRRITNPVADSWCALAVGAAIRAGCEMPGLDAVVAGVAADLEVVRRRSNGLFVPVPLQQRQAKESRTFTVLAIHALQTVGVADSTILRGLRMLGRGECDWQKPPVPWPMYYWYYATEAAFHADESLWRQWFPALARQYVRNQNEDGSWLSPPAPVPDEVAFRDENHYGPAFTTALGALTLQVYHRFPPGFGLPDADR